MTLTKKEETEAENPKFKKPRNRLISGFLRFLAFC